MQLQVLAEVLFISGQRSLVEGTKVAGLASQRFPHSSVEMSGDWNPNPWALPCQSVCVCVCVLSHSVVSDSLQSYALYLSSLLCPWNFPGKNTGVGCYFLLQGIFPAQGLNLSLLCLPHWQADSLPLRHLGNPPPCQNFPLFHAASTHR